jgi:hypothetical protein
MAYRRTGLELLYTATAALAIAAAFHEAAGAYPPGRATIGWIGAATVVLSIVMVLPQLRDAWRADRAARRG